MKIHYFILLFIINSRLSTQLNPETTNSVEDKNEAEVISDLYRQLISTARQVIELDSDKNHGSQQYSEKINSLYYKVDNMQNEAKNELNELLMKTFGQLSSGSDSMDSNNYEPFANIMQQFLTGLRSNTEGIADTLKMFKELMNQSVLMQSGLTKALGLDQ